MNVERLTRPVSGILSIEELGWQTRTGGPSDMGENYFQPELDRFALSAIREAEDYAQMALLTQTIRVILPCWPRPDTIALPITPLLDWSSVTVTADGTAFDDFAVMTGQRPALRLTGARPAGEIIIDYAAGFGDQPEDIPADLRHALLDQVACYFDARGAVGGKTATLSPHFARIVGRYRGVRA